MSRYSYESYTSMQKNTQKNNNNERKVGYLKLKDKDEALIRINISAISDIELVTVHDVEVKDKFRTISCLRKSFKDPIDACPLCSQGKLAKTKLYLKVLKYNVDEFGKVTSTDAVVLQLAKRYSDKIVTFLQEYGDLRDVVFKVKRTGSGTDTQYDFMYQNPVKYSEANGFVKDFSAFDGFDLAHHSFSEKTREEIEEFLMTGEFPLPQRKEVKEEVPTHPMVEEQEDEHTPGFTTPIITATAVPPVTSVESTTSRPRRTYDWDN